MNPVTIGPIQIAKTDLGESLFIWLIGGLATLGLWALWVWGFRLDGVPAWSYYFAFLLGAKCPNYYIRKAR